LLEGKVARRILIKEATVSTNDSWPLIYLPKVAIENLGLRRGCRVLVFLDVEEGSLVIKPCQGELPRGD
jgi:hypothetical protein